MAKVKIEELKTMDRFILLEIKKWNETTQVQPRVADVPENEGKDPTKDEMVTEDVKVKIKKGVQQGVVKVSNSNNVQVGDTVYFFINSVKEFDLFKNTYLISEFDIIAKGDSVSES